MNTQITFFTFIIFILTTRLGFTAPDLNVLDAGAVSDGKADNTAAFQKSLDKAADNGGGIVYVPAGHYKFTGHFTIPKNVTLRGSFAAAPYVSKDEIDKDSIPGSVLLPTADRDNPDGTPFITMDSNSAVDGFIIHYPEWRNPADNHPYVYPPCISSAKKTSNLSIKHMNIVDAYYAIRMIDSTRFLISDVQGYPSYRGIVVDGSDDASRIENTHFIWQGGVLWAADDPYCEWVNFNGIAFEFGKSRFQTVSHCFSFGYGVGFKFSSTKRGACDGSFIACGADSAERAILVDKIQQPGVVFANTVFLGHWFGKSAMGVVINPGATGRLSIENCWFAGSVTKNIWMKSDKAVLSVQNSSFVGWDVNQEGIVIPCIQIDAGKATFKGNWFGYGSGWHAGKNHKQLLAGPKIKSLLFCENTGEKNFELDNQAGTKALIKDNIAN
ncbi:MAG: glycosyl hydrolase family 28-related protein [Armatimonadota bacterium]